jgi:predicted amino acid dehydrogenase
MEDCGAEKRPHVHGCPEKRCVVFLSQLREEPHNTEVQQAQITDEMRWEMDEYGSFKWSETMVMDGVKFIIRLINRDPFTFIKNRTESVADIMAAMERAKRVDGATDIGLGSLVASVAHGGRDLLAKAEELNLRLDHGDDMSTGLAATAAWHLRDFGLDLASGTVGVIGAVGIMGAGFIRLLSRNVRKFLFVVTSIDERVIELRNQLLAEAASEGRKLEIATGTHFHALAEYECRLVYVAHSAPSAPLKAEHLASRTIVLDACIPPAVAFRDGSHLVLPVGCGILPKSAAPKGVGVRLGLGETENGPVIYGCMIGCMLAAGRGDMIYHKIFPVEPEYAKLLLAQGSAIGVTHQPFPVEEREIREFIRRQ